MIFEMISSTHFAISIKNSYSRELVDCIKRISEARFEAKSKSWIVPLQKKDDLIDSVTQTCL